MILLDQAIRNVTVEQQPVTVTAQAVDMEQFKSALQEVMSHLAQMLSQHSNPMVPTANRRYALFAKSPAVKNRRLLTKSNGLHLNRWHSAGTKSTKN